MSAGSLFFIRRSWRRLKLDCWMFRWTEIPQIVAIQFMPPFIVVCLCFIRCVGEHDALCDLEVMKSFFHTVHTILIAASTYLPFKRGIHTRESTPVPRTNTPND